MKFLDLTPESMKNEISFLFSLRPFKAEKKHNFNKLKKSLSGKQLPIRQQQIHSSKITIVNKNNMDKIGSLQGDGLITNIKNVTLAVLVADCLAIAVYDPVNKIKALAHAGWRGTMKNISAKLIKSMERKFKTNPKNCFVGISPGIGKCCYKISGELSDKFKLKYKYHNLFLRNNYLDLKELNKLQLINSGVKNRNIKINRLCTYCNPELFFSYRRSTGTGNRHIAFLN